MNKVNGEAFTIGGAIAMSEYETEMSPDEQSNYEDLVDRNLRQAYNLDPYKGNLDYVHWLGTVRSDLLADRASEWDEFERGLKQRGDRMDMSILQIAGSLQKLAHLHTGRIEDIIEIAKSLPEDSPVQ